MSATFDTSSHAHYDVVHIRKFDNRSHQLSNKDILSNITQQSEVTSGDSSDIIKFWKLYYNRMGWNSICPFNEKEHIGDMYALFKDKNVGDLDTRRKKLKEG